MMRDRAVALFAKSTFSHFLAFTLQNKWIGSLRELKRGQYYEIVEEAHHHRYRFEVVFGPPHDTTVYAAAETGCRILGDDRCWTIMKRNIGEGLPVHHHTIRLMPLDPMAPQLPSLWYTFEVVDWQMLHDGEGTYMKIGEPFVLR